MSPNDDDTLLDEREAAEMLKTSASSLQKQRHTGNGPPFVKIGHLVRYRRPDLRTYVAERIVRSTSQRAG
jgi:predicted DNA-binding transcriptional regulator AlpA